MIVLRHSIPLGIVVGFALLLAQVTPHNAHADSGFFDEEFEFEEEEETFFYEEEPLYYEEEEEIVEVFDEYEFEEGYEEFALDEEIDVDDIEYEEFEEEEFDDYERYERELEFAEEELDEDFFQDEMDMADERTMDMEVGERTADTRQQMVEEESEFFEDYGFFDLFSGEEEEEERMVTTATKVQIEDQFEDYGTFDDTYDDYGAGGGSVGGCAVVGGAALDTGLVTLDCGSWTMSLDGLIQVDAAFYNSVTLDTATSFADIRRAYLGVKGTYQRDWAYKLTGLFAASHEYEDHRTKAGLHDAFIQYNGYDNATVRVGLFTVPFGLEQTAHDHELYFMERPAGFYDITSFGITGTFAKRGNTISGTLHMSGLDDSDSEKQSARAQGDIGVAGRFTSAFKFRNRSLLHLGFSGRYADFNNNDSQTGAILNIGAPFSGAFGAPLSSINYDSNYRNEELYAINPEVALVMGAVGLQAEYTLIRPTVMDTRTQIVSDSTMHLWYLQMNYWITGESNQYNEETGTFGRVKPRSSFLGSGRGSGAIGFGVRYQYADLQDGIASFGRHESLTVNMSWLPNAYTKFTAEFVRAWLAHADGTTSAPYGIQFRAQVDW